jgi:hypothetical protein
MNARSTVLLAALVLLVPAAARATVYKCLLDGGGVFYQDTPCAPGRELRDFDKDPANVSVVPFGPPASTPGKPSTTRPHSARAEPKPRTEPRARSAPSKKPARAAGDATQRRFLRPGMSEGEVIARVGAPDMTRSASRKGSRWIYMPVSDDPHTITNLVFENGRLAEVERKVIR